MSEMKTKQSLQGTEQSDNMPQTYYVIQRLQGHVASRHTTASRR